MIIIFRTLVVLFLFGYVERRISMLHLTRQYLKNRSFNSADLWNELYDGDGVYEI